MGRRSGPAARIPHRTRIPLTLPGDDASKPTKRRSRHDHPLSPHPDRHRRSGLVLMLGASQAFATAFPLDEKNASGLGNAFAAAAATADDASAMWWNPAGLALSISRRSSRRST